MATEPWAGKRVLVTGGTGSLGKAIIHHLLQSASEPPSKIMVFSRDEAKQHALRMAYAHQHVATDEIVYRNFERLLEFHIGDVRDYRAICRAVRSADIVFNAAALKQVPTCEYFPYEAVLTNVLGAENLVRAIHDLSLPVEVVVGVSTDKAVLPVNVMGMTKAIQERIFARANLAGNVGTRFVSVRYGNVLVSRGSVIPLFWEQISHGGPVTITDERMTRFLLSLEEAVEVIFESCRSAKAGETLVPRIPAAKIMDVARALIGDRPIEIRTTGIRPGEKLHELLVSEEESRRTRSLGSFYAIGPLLPELREEQSTQPAASGEYSSRDHVLSATDVRALLARHNLLEESPP